MPMSEDPRQRLLEEAGRKFAEKGFEGANVREITEAAGMSVAAVNYHFRSKEELYIAAVRHAAESCLTITPIPTWSEEVGPEQRLRDFIGAFLLRLLREDSPRWHRMLIMREVADPRPGACEEFVRCFIRPQFELLQGILRALTPIGTPRECLELAGASIVGQCLHYHHARHVMPLLMGQGYLGEKDVARLTEHIWRFSMAALEGLYGKREQGEKR